MRCEEINISGGMVRQKAKYERFLRKRSVTNPRRGAVKFRCVPPAGGGGSRRSARGSGSSSSSNSSSSSSSSVLLVLWELGGDEVGLGGCGYPQGGAAGAGTTLGVGTRSGTAAGHTVGAADQKEAARAAWTVEAHRQLRQRRRASQQTVQAMQAEQAGAAVASARIMVRL